ncbi:MAG: hypothetical protein E7443_02670 [Ruminococcaceae bacterium]|nr:hypothetical protein [Oscillospiraceae bacterium]
MTKDEMLTLLLDAYAGPGSTREGTFAGDVLRACADGMAQLWSMDIDGLERRAFVSTAIGDWLTAVCADRGVVRRENESDEDLRARTLEKLAGIPASGNIDHYEAWCLESPDLLRVKVFPLARGNGTVDIVAVASDGKAPSAAVLAAAQAAVDRERPIGADARVLAAEETALNVSAAVRLMDGAEIEAVCAAFTAALTSFCRDLALRTTTVSYSKALRLLLDCEGVADVSGFALNGGDQSLILAENAVPVCGTLSLQEAGA